MTVSLPPMGRSVGLSVPSVGSCAGIHFLESRPYRQQTTSPAVPPLHHGRREANAEQWKNIPSAPSGLKDDINFDGYLDFSVVCEFAASGDRRCYWVYDPGSQLFAQNELTHELAGWWGFNEVNPAKHEITRHFLVTAMAGCPDTVEREEERYRVNNNHLLLIHKQEIMREPQLCTVTESDLIGGTMRVTKVRRYDAREQRVK